MLQRKADTILILHRSPYFVLLTKLTVAFFSRMPNQDVKKKNQEDIRSRNIFNSVFSVYIWRLNYGTKEIFKSEAIKDIGLAVRAAFANISYINNQHEI